MMRLVAAGALLMLCVAPVAATESALPEKNISLVLQAADLRAAVHSLAVASGVPMRLLGEPQARKVTLSVDPTPLRDVLDAVARLYGARWRQEGEGVVFVPIDPNASEDEASDRQVEAAIDLLFRLSQEKWGEGDKRLQIAASRAIDSVPREDVTRLVQAPQLAIPFENLSAEQQRLALVAARRLVLGFALSALAKGPSLAAARTGAGIKVQYGPQAGGMLQLTTPASLGGRGFLLVGVPLDQ